MQSKRDKHPYYIEKRTFTCSSCGYSAQVYGGQYFDYGCREYIITFRCPECRILFENLVTEFNIAEPFAPITHELADEIVCMWCGSDKVRVWSKDTGRCPKCGGEMAYSVDGEIKVQFPGEMK